MGKTRLHSAQSASAAVTVGGWVEVGRTTLESTSSSIDVTSLPDKRYYMILSDKKFTGSDGGTVARFNSDSATNYAERFSPNGTTDQTYTSIAHFTWGTANTASGQTQFTVGYVTNLSSKEKLVFSHSTDTVSSGAGTSPDRLEGIGKWANTSSAISAFSDRAYGGGSVIASGSEVVVLGWSPDDADTGGFWEELASVELSGTADNISSGTITAKKYLWIQFYQKPAGACNIKMTFNNDTGNNYASRGSDDGAADFTLTSDSSLAFETSDTDSAHFFSMFIVNNSANEKLGISQGITQNTAGADISPQRKEQVHKWANTSAQITEIDIDNTDSGSYDTGSILKVWGHD